MIKNIRHAAIVVQDFQKSVAFYRDFLGLSTASENIETGPFIESVVGLPEVRLQWIKLKTPNGVLIELLKYLNPVSPPAKNSAASRQASHQTGHSHLAFTVENVDAFVQALPQHHGHKVNAPLINPEGTAKVCYVHDPEGNILEIVEEIRGN